MSYIPTHAMETHHPDGTVSVVRCIPCDMPDRTPGYCKYCYRTHRKWWKMKAEDYFGRDDIVLCGKCEHTSTVKQTERIPDSFDTETPRISGKTSRRLVVIQDAILSLRRDELKRLAEWVQQLASK